MLISGNDIVIRTQSPLELAEETVKLIRFKWKQLLIENADSGDIIAFEFPFFQSLPKEFFVYENALAKKSWDDQGACSQNANTMFHVIVQPVKSRSSSTTH